MIVGTSASDCQERLICEMTYYVWSGMYNTHSTVPAGLQQYIYIVLTKHFVVVVVIVALSSPTITKVHCFIIIKMHLHFFLYTKLPNTTMPQNSTINATTRKDRRLNKLTLTARHLNGNSTTLQTYKHTKTHVNIR